ncbi:MAG TPA: FtsX-like permease family protein [Solirubrobacteraceae bacterium]|jgi:putative ABC transport system permease protein|nr:FtsX-like permease family protein [Solirubrobacteraceae bacterium]
MSPEPRTRGLVTRRLLAPRTLIYFYRRRLRAHGVQELLAGVGIAAAVALVLAAGVSQGSVTASSRKVVRAVIGSASLQLRARGPAGFPEATLKQVEALDGVKQAAPLLERSVRMIGPDGRQAEVYLAGTDLSLAVLNGLLHTLPLDALSNGKVALSAASAHALSVSGGPEGSGQQVSLLVGGVRHPTPVSAVLGHGTVGALSGALVAVTPLASMQQLLGEPGRITRILVQPAPGKQAEVRRELARLAGSTLIVGDAEEDIALLEQALKPSGQASALFAVIGALLGFLFAFNAILLTVPERRQAIADLRLSGTRRSAIVQLQGFQALCLGVGASVVGVGIGYVLSRWVFHQSTGYLQEAFTLSGATVLSAGSVLEAAVGGIVVTCLASALPLLDLRHGRPPDAIYMHDGVPGNALARGPAVWLFALGLALLAGASVLYAAAPSAALAASAALALATVLVIPVMFAGVLGAARMLSERAPRLSTLAIALGGVRGTTVRSLALAATGAVALFGSVALGGARANLLSGIQGFAHAYAADAPIWVGEPGDNQAIEALAGGGQAQRIARVPGVGSVQSFQGSFLTVGDRRVWILARPPGAANHVLESQTIGGAGAAATAQARLAEGGWVAVSRQIAAEHHSSVGGTITLPTPTGNVAYRVAALTTNLAWSPGVVFMSAADYTKAWGASAPSALAVHPAPGASLSTVTREIEAALGPASGLAAVSARTRQARIDTLTSEGLSQLGLISTLLILAAILALAAALASSIHQRRTALASLRLAGAPPSRLRRILLLEGSLMLGAGCVTGALAGVYGQFVIDAYLRHVTGFPVASAGASARPIAIFAIVLAAALLIVALPGWRASIVPPSLALAEE